MNKSLAMVIFGVAFIAGATALAIKGHPAMAFWFGCGAIGSFLSFID